ncbi:hypothetical protein [Actinomadura coerulea]|uniref:hypothetical protein n=1 Tax=Actinomadura coerulea TaxID=46159 RepID=UPI00343C3564
MEAVESYGRTKKNRSTAMTELLNKDDLVRALVRSRSGQWTLMVVDIDPERVYRLDPLAGRYVRKIAMERLTRLHSRRQVFDIGEGRYVVLIKRKVRRATKERDGGELAERISDALTADLGPWSTGLAAAIGYAEGALPLDLLVPAADATRLAATQRAYNCALPIVRPNARIEQGRAETTSID